MSIFGSIMGAIFGSKSAQAAPPTASAQSSGAHSSAGGGSSAAASASAQTVDVEAVLNERASKNSQKLNWRTSIVDLMKLLDLDSGLSSRKELAKERLYREHG